MARICVPVCVSRVSELADAVRAASEVADMIELRLDYLAENELSHAGEAIASVLQSTQKPVVLTLRPAEYGGHRPMSAEGRLFFRLQNPFLLRPDHEDLWDMEVDLALLLQQREREGNDVESWGQCEWARTICSYHDFVGVPADLKNIYEQMASTRSRALKIALQTDDAVDCLPIFKLLERAQGEGREFIAIGMGEAGAVTRILGPSRGSYLTFASLDDDKGTAPGQITAEELRSLYRIDRIDRQTEIFGIMGQPVSQSMSPYIHNAAFAARDLNSVYLRFEVRDAKEFMRRMAHPKSRELDWNLRGLSVTTPHKSTVIGSLDWIDPAAREIGAVNTIVIHDDELRGYNTDAAGFVAPLLERFGSLKASRCAVVGAGGAARAVLWALRESGADVTLFARNAEKATELAKQYAVPCESLTNSTFAAFDIVINATPLGMRGAHQNDSVATAEQLRGVPFAYDLVYNPIETRFIREARDAGCETLSGVEMLLAQAVEQFKLWTGLEPDREVMRDTVMRALD